MSHSVLVVLVMSLVLAVTVRAADPAPREKIRIACVGDSVTFGDGLKERSQAYPGQLQKLLGDGYDVRNFGVNSMAILKKADFSYFNNPAYKAALDFKPNIVVMQFGGNDSKTQNWVHKADFMHDAKELIDSFRALPTKPRIIINTTSPAFVNKWAITDDCILNEVIPQLRQTAFDESLEIIDIHTALLGMGDKFPDKMHPGPEACTYIAKVVESTLIFKDDPAFNIEKLLADKKLTMEVSSFYGFRQINFALPDGHKATIVRPYRVAVSHPFAWRGEFFGHEPQTDIALLQRGFHIVYVEAPNLYGSPAAMKIWDDAYGFFKDGGLTGKITLIGMSRGALNCYHWAMLHPETVAVLYGDAPVCDFTSWPGKDRAGAAKTEWTELLKAYNFKDDAEALAYKLNPVDNLAPLAKAYVAILHVVGDADKTVSVAENSDVVEKRYKELAGTIQVIHKANADHHPHSLPNPEPIVQFILDHNK